MSASAAETCVYHPDRPSAGNCTNCNQPTCFGCQMTVAGKTVCQRCVAAIRARVSSEVNAPAPTPGAYAQPGAYTQPGAYAPPQQPVLSPYGNVSPTGDYPSAAYQPYAVPQAPIPTMHVGHVLGGLGLGFLAGILGVAAWWGMVMLTHFDIAIYAVGVGWLIGIATVKGAGGRGGNVVAVMSAILAFVICGIGVIPSFLEGAGWSYIFGAVCLFYGVRRAYITPMNAPQQW